MIKNETISSQEIIQRLKSAPELYVLASVCTGAPYVACSPETFDDEIMLFFDVEEARKKAKEMVESGVLVNIVKLENRQFLLFYTSLYTMGVNAVLISGGGEERLVQLGEFVRHQKPEHGPDGKVWVENPALHLTALYYMQELRRKPGQENSPQLKEWQDEIASHFAKGSFIIPVEKEGNGTAMLKLNDGQLYHAIFTDALEFQKFNKDNKLRAMIVTADKIPQMLAEEAKGVILNPMGVRMPLMIRKPAGQ